VCLNRGSRFSLVLPVFFLTVVLFGGCAPKEAMLTQDSMSAAGNYEAASVHARSQIDADDRYDRDNLLWYLNCGSARFFDGDYAESIGAFDESEALMKHFREQMLASDVAQTLSSLLINDAARPYQGSEYDGIMVNTYKAIDYMMLGDEEGARVEFNRAVDRQRRAKVFFAEMIDKERDAMLEKERQSRAEGGSMDIAATMANPQIDARLRQRYPSLYAFTPYPDFINPMTTYLAGVFAMAEGNSAKANTLLKEAYGMMPDNPDVRADFLYTEALLGGEKVAKEPTVWVLFENGLAPLLTEWRMDFPAFIVSREVTFVSVALPRMKLRGRACSHLLVDDGAVQYRSRHLASMERVIQTEFKKNYPATVRRALFSAMVKTFVQFQMHQQGGDLAGLAAALYQIASTRADTRIWSTLPKEFQLARFTRPESGKVTLRMPDGRKIAELQLPERSHILVYVKIPTSTAVPSVSMIPFGGEE
jgi:hypothetical protein